MNGDFSRWSRSTAFNISLTGSACDTLLEMHAWESELVKVGKDPADYGTQIFDRTRANYLQKRGLIYKLRPDNEDWQYSYALTKEGGLLSQLLVSAGFKQRECDIVAVFPELRSK